MTKQSLLELVFLLIISSFLTTAGILFYIQNPVDVEEPDYFTPVDMIADLPRLTPTPTPEPYLPECIDNAREIRRRLGELTITKTRLVLGNEYRMFITAYCSAECGGSTMTSSGATVHRSDDPYEPTTCAIDRRYFRYGDLFYVPSEDRVYVAEDTGSGVKGMWLDTYQLDYATVQSYNTRYETIYTCEVEYYDVLADNYNIHGYILEDYLEMIEEQEEFIDERL